MATGDLLGLDASVIEDKQPISFQLADVFANPDETLQTVKRDSIIMDGSAIVADIMGPSNIEEQKCPPEMYTHPASELRGKVSRNDSINDISHIESFILEQSQDLEGLLDDGYSPEKSTGRVS